MKRFILIIGILFSLGSYSNLDAQVVNVNINLGRQPAWGPVGYDYAGYYYFPDMDVYYDVNAGSFIYLDAGRWVSAYYLPYAYRRYNLYNMYKVVLNDRRPWFYNYNHRTHYARYRGHYNQPMIRDSRDVRYNDSRRNTRGWYNESNGRNNNSFRSNSHNSYNSRNNQSGRAANSTSNSRGRQNESNYQNSSRGNNRDHANQSRNNSSGSRTQTNRNR